MIIYLDSPDITLVKRGGLWSYRKNGKLRGSSCKASRAKLSKKDLILIFKLKAKGLYYKDIAKRLGVSVGTIGRVINKKSYRDENIDRKR